MNFTTILNAGNTKRNIENMIYTGYEPLYEDYRLGPPVPLRREESNVRQSNVRQYRRVGHFRKNMQRQQPRFPQYHYGPQYSQGISQFNCFVVNQEGEGKSEVHITNNVSYGNVSTPVTQFSNTQCVQKGKKSIVEINNTLHKSVKDTTPDESVSYHRGQPNRRTTDHIRRHEANTRPDVVRVKVEPNHPNTRSQ